MNVLIVEAALQQRRRLHRLVKACGHQPHSCSNDIEAFQFFQNTHPDVVLAGDGGASRDGRSLCRRIRALVPIEETYLILIRKAGRATRSVEAEADDFLTLPAGPAEVRGRLELASRVLQRRREDSRQWRRVVRIPSDSPHPILEMTPTGNLLHANPAALPMLEAWGWNAGAPPPSALLSLLRKVKPGDDPEPTELCCSTRVYSFIGVLAEDGNVTLYGHDVTERSAPMPIPEVESRSGFNLFPRDALTGLPQRSLFVDRVQRTLEVHGNSGLRLALIKVNIDNLRQLNEALGHHVGDQAIRLVAETLLDHLSDKDSVCREAGDQFAVLHTSIGSRKEAGQFCERLSRAVSQLAAREEAGVRLTLSFGVALFPDDATSASVLDLHAQQALAEAKRSGRDCWRDFSSAAGANPLILGDHLYSRLVDAVAQRQIQVHYHPIVDATTGNVAAFEALARWYNRELGWVSPAQFIPVAEARGLITEVARQVSSQAFGQLAEWRAAGHNVGLSLNISKRQLLNPSYPAELAAQAAQHRIRPETVMLETTERQAFLHEPRCRETLGELAKAGFRLSLDDFGAGHSSFDMVADLPFHEVKIDMGVARKAVHPRGKAVVKAITSMCRGLGMGSVAEGVEDPEQRDALVELSINRLQGHLFSPPLPGHTTFLFLRGNN